MDKAISENLAFLMNNGALPAATAQQPQSVMSIPAYSSAGLVLSTQSEILSELEQRLRNLTQQLENIGLDVQMATVTFDPEDSNKASGTLPKCLLDCQQVASRSDRLGKQLQTLRADIEDKQKTQFYDQMVAEEIYAKLDDLRAKQQELQFEMESLSASFGQPVASTLAQTALELERSRMQWLSEFNSAQLELDEATELQRENVQAEQTKCYGDLSTKLREYYRSQLATLGSRFLNNSDNLTADSQRLLSQGTEQLNSAQTTLKQIASQTDQFIELGNKLIASLKTKATGAVNRPTISQIELDVKQLTALQSMLATLMAFRLENAESIALMSSELRKVNAVMNTIWTPTSDPMSRWCDALKKLSNTRLDANAATWVRNTCQTLTPQCLGCATTVRQEIGEIEKQNLVIDQLRRQLASDALGANRRDTEAEKSRFTLNGLYEADHHKLGIECRKATDARLNLINQELRESKSKNRTMLDNHIERTQKSSASVRTRLADAVALTPAKQAGTQFLNQLAQLESIDNQILTVEGELAQLRRAKQRSENLRKQLIEARDLYARTQDVVEAIRPGATRRTPTSGSTVFMLTVEVYGVQQVNEDLIEDSATVELRVGTQSRAVVVPINEDTDVPTASLNFPRVTTAAPLIVNIKTAGKLRGHYEMPLEGIELNEWVDYQLPESSQSLISTSTNDLEPILSIKLNPS